MFPLQMALVLLVVVLGFSMFAMKEASQRLLDMDTSRDAASLRTLLLIARSCCWLTIISSCILLAISVGKTP